MRIPVALVLAALLTGDGTAAAAGAPSHFFTEAQLTEARAAVAGEDGARLLKRMLYLSGAELAQHDRIREAGYQAAGHAAVYALTGDAAHAAAARDMVLRRICTYPLEEQLAISDRAARLIGIVLANDLARAAWDEPTCRQVEQAIDLRTARLLELRRTADSDEVTDLLASCAAGLAALAREADPAATARCRPMAEEAAARVRTWLDRDVSPLGIAVQGEGLKQVIFASAVLPFAHAWQRVRGETLLPPERLEAILRAFMRQTVPGAGTVVFTNAGSVLDRTGFLALSAGVVSSAFRPELAWFFGQVVPDGHYDVARPVHGLYLLLAPPWTVTPAAPPAPWALADHTGGIFVLRTAQGGSNDLLAAIVAPQGRAAAGQAGDLRIMALGRWVSGWGRDVMTYAPDPIRQRNGLGFAVRGRVELEAQSEVLHADSTPNGSGTVSLRRTGTVRTIPEQRERSPEKQNPVSGPFQGLRAFAADYSGACGAPALFVLLDTLEAPAGAPTAWALHTDGTPVDLRRRLQAINDDFRNRYANLDEQVAAKTLSLPAYEVQSKALDKERKAAESAARDLPYADRILLGSNGPATFQITYKAAATNGLLRAHHNPPYWNGLAIADAARVLAVMTVSTNDAHPAVEFTGAVTGICARVGPCTVGFDGVRLTLATP